MRRGGQDIGGMRALGVRMKESFGMVLDRRVRYLTCSTGIHRELVESAVGGA